MMVSLLGESKKIPFFLQMFFNDVVERLPDSTSFNVAFSGYFVIIILRLPKVYYRIRNIHHSVKNIQILNFQLGRAFEITIGLGTNSSQKLFSNMPRRHFSLIQVNLSLIHI